MLTASVRIEAIDALDCRLVAHDWDFERRERAAIADHWARERAKNPALYDGVILLACAVEEKDIRHEDGAPRGRALGLDFFKTRFSAFLAWRDFGFPDTGVYNAFSMPAALSSDGAFLLGEMGADHSCAGKVYFPAGTPDLLDVDNGRVDLDGSWRRELAEETGLVAKEGAAAPGWDVVFDSQRVACMKQVRFPYPANEMKTRVEAFLRGEEKPELAGAHMIASRDQLVDPRIPPFTSRYLGHALERSSAHGGVRACAHGGVRA